MSKKSAKTHDAAISRRRFLESTGAAGLATAIVSLAGTARAQAKASKNAVMYRGTPNGGRRCAGCIYFQPGKRACTRVAGDILPNGWCAIWRKR